MKKMNEKKGSKNPLTTGLLSSFAICLTLALITNALHFEKNVVLFFVYATISLFVGLILYNLIAYQNPIVKG